LKQGKKDQNNDIAVEETDQYVIISSSPLCGSSSIDTGIPTGAIIGVYKHDDKCINDTKTDADGTADCPKLGTNLVTAQPIICIPRR